MNSKIPFQWQIPNKPPDDAALARMKQHFRQPKELMPEAWFIGAEIKYYTWLAETPPDSLDSEVLAKAMGETAGGIVAFPEVSFVETWKAWFQYLLPYAIVGIDKYFTRGYETIIGETVTALMSVYPQTIHEEYEGFRDDVVYSLGVRIIPRADSLEELSYYDVCDLLDAGAYLNTSDDFSLPVLFCLKYLTPKEIDDWVKSIIGIQHHAWRFGVIVWWLAYRKFLQRAVVWPENGDMESLLDTEQDKLVHAFWITRMSFASLDTFISQANRVAYEVALAKYLTIEVFKSWAEDISSHRTFEDNGQIIPMPKSLFDLTQRVVKEFEQQFFAHRPSI